MREVNANKRFQQTVGGALVALLLGWCAIAWAEEGIHFKRHGVHQVDSGNNVYLVSAQIDYQLSPYLEQALLNGIVLNSSIRVVLVKPRNWWWNQAETLSVINYELKYHSLSRHFLLTRVDTSENWNFRSLTAALRKMGGVVNHRLPALPQTIHDGGHLLYLSAVLSPATLRLPLKIQSIFSSQYSMSSEVIQWPLP
ncbi:MAG: DUF4390 domain-containing protein [Leucothrix sp.]